MTKAEFAEELEKNLAGLPKEDIKRSLDYYSEMIEDRIEGGMTEEDAVSAIGSVKEITDRILSEIPITKIVKENVKPGRSLRTWEIVLIAVGSPVWLPILLSLVIVCLAVYLVFWIVVAALYASDLFFGFAGIVGLIATFVQTEGFNYGVICFGIGLICTGVAILLFFGCNQVAKGLIYLTKKMFLGIKYLFVGGKKSEES